MKVLYITQYFLTPDQAGGSRHYYHVKHLKKQGHQVDVITTYVQDHMSRVIPPKYRRKLSVLEYCEGIPVYKTYSSPNYGQGFWDRMKNYLSFMFCAILVGLKITGRYDVVFASSPSLFVGFAGYILALFKRGRFVLEVRDLWPKSAIILGFLRNPFFISLAKRLEKFLYVKAQAIIALTWGIYGFIARTVKDEKKVKLVTNGIDEDLFAHPQTSDIKRKHGLENKFIAIYVGSHGINNDLETIIDAADILKKDKEIYFVFVGGGDHKTNLMELCRKKELNNALFLPPKPKSEIVSYLNEADVCLLAIKKGPFFNGTLPNKLFDYLAGGRPIIASTPKQGESAYLINKFNAGIVCDPEDGEKMAQAIRHVYQNKNVYQDLSTKARTAALEQFSRFHLAYRFEAILKDAAKSKRKRT